jgi:starch phosphorylase
MSDHSLDDRRGLDAASLRHGFLDHCQFSEGRPLGRATTADRFTALALTIRDRLMHRWSHTQAEYQRLDPKRVYYLSAEFLLGRALGNNLQALGLHERMKQTLTELGVDLGDLLEEEHDAGLGNGGLGRLAACFLDSMATLGIAGYGYGIRYEFGIFRQEIRDGHQVEMPDEWLRFGNPWEVMRPEYSAVVNFGGRMEDGADARGRYRPHWVGTSQVLGVPYDTPIAGFECNTVNTLRLWRARASQEFDLTVFNDGDYVRAVEDKNASEVISKVLYPNDHNQAGRDLRLKQEYFFVACSISDIVRRYLRHHDSFDSFASKNAIQLNDTHPAIAVAELMRVLVDLHDLPWAKAWEITSATFGYTNHTLLPEALEKWSVSMFERLLPRHLQIIFEINHRFLHQVSARFPNDPERLGRMSIVEEGVDRKVRMAHLAVVGSHAVNGVAALHSQLLREHVLRDFAEMMPERFSNKTNGVTPRRWLLTCNPRLASLITEAIGPKWTTQLDRLEELLPFANDRAFVQKVRAAKLANKEELAATLMKTMRLEVDPGALFDVQVKRLHEYKRQLLNALHIVRMYLDARQDPDSLSVPRVMLFAAKAAPGYRSAKLIIKFINSIARVINADRRLHGRLKVAFLPNYRVSLAEQIIPASDLSEQISTAGKEASGTGNMKFSMNGALTIGTLDGANVEIREAVGKENFFLFGLTEEEVAATKAKGYHPRSICDQEPRVREVMEAVSGGMFDGPDRGIFAPLAESLMNQDEYLLLADFASYCAAQKKVSDLYASPDRWHAMAVRNIAKMGMFSSDRTIREYANAIWNAPSLVISDPPLGENLR